MFKTLPILGLFLWFGVAAAIALYLFTGTAVTLYNKVMRKKYDRWTVMFPATVLPLAAAVFFGMTYWVRYASGYAFVHGLPEATYEVVEVSFPNPHAKEYYGVVHFKRSDGAIGKLAMHTSEIAAVKSFKQPLRVRDFDIVKGSYDPFVIYPR